MKCWLEIGEGYECNSGFGCDSLVFFFHYYTEKFLRWYTNELGEVMWTAHVCHLHFPVRALVEGMPCETKSLMGMQNLSRISSYFISLIK